MTDPLVPPGVDLRSYDWFPFHHKRLRQSAFWKRASDVACRISVDLWAEAYEQVPAASLPDDDHLLSDWAGFGRRDLSAWLAVKDEVMGAWVLCSDGRWYHPTLSEVALQAWVERRIHLWSRECDRIRKENSRRAKAGQPALEMPTKPSNDPFENVGDLPSAGTPPVSAGRPKEHVEDPAENALTRTRTRTGTRTLKEGSSSLCSEDTRSRASPTERPAAKPKTVRRHPFPPDAFERWYGRYPHKVARAPAEKAFAKVRASDTVSLDVLISAVDRYRVSKPPEREWCNPATWLNQARWADEPAASGGSGSPAVASGAASEPRVDLGDGLTAPYSAIRSFWSRRRWDDQWGPDPDHPGCRIPPSTLSAIMSEAA